MELLDQHGNGPEGQDDVMFGGYIEANADQLKDQQKGALHPMGKNLVC